MLLEISLQHPHLVVDLICLQVHNLNNNHPSNNSSAGLTHLVVILSRPAADSMHLAVEVECNSHKLSPKDLMRLARNNSSNNHNSHRNSSSRLETSVLSVHHRPGLSNKEGSMHLVVPRLNSQKRRNLLLEVLETNQLLPRQALTLSAALAQHKVK